MENYLIIHKSVLPPYFEQVVKAKNLLEQGKVESVSQATKEAGISRSTYYKYKDYVLEPANLKIGTKAVITMMLNHQPGVLNNVLTCISKAKGSIITITQSLPIHGMANVTVSLDASNIDNLQDLIEKISKQQGVDSPELIAVE